MKAPQLNDVYKIAYTLVDIPFSVATKLQSLNVIVPYDSSMSNNYLYVPVSLDSGFKNKDLKSAMQGIDFYPIDNFSTTYADIKKHLVKIDNVNTFQIGDYVKYRPFNSLLFVITDINYGIATLKHNLRFKDLVVEANIQELVKTDETFNLYTNKDYMWHSQSLIVDCNSFNFQIHSFLNSFLSVLYQLKLRNLTHNIVLVNPCHIVLKFAFIYGLFVLVSELYNFKHSVSLCDCLIRYDYEIIDCVPQLNTPEPILQNEYFNLQDSYYGSHPIQTAVDFIKGVTYASV